MQPAREEGRLTRLSAGIGRVFPPWRQWTSRQRTHASLILLLMVTSVIHQLIFVYWYIEDAAISFSYARNYADGEGFVTYPGGERVEGFSDPLWVYLMVVWEVFGVNGFTSSKIMGCIFGAFTLPVSYLLAEEAFGRPSKPSHYSLIAPAFLAGSAQFAIWNASGLENSLFCFLLAMGMWRTLVDSRTGAWPSAPAWFLGLTITRPEGILYAAFGGFWAMVLTLQYHRSFSHTMKWLVTFFLPFTGYQAMRYSYFAWAFPNTYYAKLGSKEFMPFAWNARGWKYLRDWAHLLWHGYLIPVYLLGLFGRKSGAWWSMVGTVVIFTILLLPGPDFAKSFWPWTAFTAPPGWTELRVWLLLLLALVLPLRALGGEGWRARVLCWGMAFIALFFALWSGGDWMKGFRWMSLLTVPSAVLFAAGSREIAPVLGALLAPIWVPLITALRTLARRGRLSKDQVRTGLTVVGTLGLIGCIAGPNIVHSAWFAKKPETGPFSVQKRVNYVNYLERRLHIEHRPTTFDVDMGANMYWSGNKIGDVAGLVDVSMAQHNYEPEFMKQYLFEELRPEFAHSHGGWASRSRVQTYPQWKEQYFEVPGYPTGRTGLHIGNWVRKDLFLETEPWPAETDTLVAYNHGIRVTGVVTPVPAGRSMHLYLELGVAFDALPERRKEDWEARIIAFVSNGEDVHSWSLPPGYDWYRPSDFQPGETFHGRFSLKLPGRLEPGEWDLGLVVIGPDGQEATIMEAGERVVHAHMEGFEPVMSAGEIRIPNAVTILPLEQALTEAVEHVETAKAHARDGDCETAESTWSDARHRTTRRDAFVAEHLPAVQDAIAGCYAARALATEDLDERTALLILAKDWDHHNDAYSRLSVRHGELMYQHGHIARADGDWELAFKLFTASVQVDPRRSWSRRFAEQVRDLQLGIDPGSVQAQKEERDRLADERRRRRDELAEKRRLRREELGLDEPPEVLIDAPVEEEPSEAPEPVDPREPGEDE